MLGISNSDSFQDASRSLIVGVRAEIEMGGGVHADKSSLIGDESKCPPEDKNKSNKLPENIRLPVKALSLQSILAWSDVVQGNNECSTNSEYG